MNRMLKIMEKAAPAAVLALAASLGAYKVRAFDLPWHLATGRWIANNLAVPRVDFFSFTREGLPWIDAQWLFQVLAWFDYDMLGPKGLSLLIVVLAVSTAVAALFAAKDKLPLAYRSLAAFLLLLSANNRIHCRPELLTMLLMALMFLVLERARSKRRWLFAAVLLQLVMANAQGLWPIGIAIFGAATLDRSAEEIRMRGFLWRAALPPAWLCALAAALLACLLQSYGVEGFLFPLKLLTEVTSQGAVQKQMIAEFQPLFALGFEPAAHIPFLLLSAGALIAAAVAGRKVRPGTLLLSVVFIYLAINARRNAGVASVFLACALTAQLAATKGRVREKLMGLASRTTVSVLAIILSLVLAVLSFAPQRRTWDASMKQPGFGMSHEFYAFETTAFLHSLHYKGNIVNNVDLGGWLIFEGWPDWKVFSDGRAEVGGEQFITLHHAVFSDVKIFREVVSRYDVTAVVVRHYEPYLQDFAIRLTLEPDWALVHVDSVGAVFLRRGKGYDEVIAKRAIPATRALGLLRG